MEQKDRPKSNDSHHMTTIPIHRARAMTEAEIRMIELRNHWLSQPENYPPPRWATRTEIDHHHHRWLASVECAHGTMLMAEAINF